MEGKKYVIAVRHDKRSEMPIDWQQRLAAIEGVSMEGATDNRAQFEAGPEAIREIQSQFGECCQIEELAGRGPL
jgi:arginase family enzyme